MIGEIVAEGIFGVAIYGIGKAMAIFFLPRLGIEPIEKQKSMPPWKWRGFTYEKSGRRFLYTESIQLLGLSILVIIIAGIVVAVHMQSNNFVRADASERRSVSLGQYTCGTIQSLDIIHVEMPGLRRRIDKSMAETAARKPYIRNLPILPVKNYRP